jgi:hypothetical protein
LSKRFCLIAGAVIVVQALKHDQFERERERERILQRKSEKIIKHGEGERANEWIRGKKVT